MGLGEKSGGPTALVNKKPPLLLTKVEYEQWSPWKKGVIVKIVFCTFKKKKMYSKKGALFSADNRPGKQMRD